MKRIEQFPPQTLLNALGTVLFCIDHLGWSHQYYAASFCQRLDSLNTSCPAAGSREHAVAHTTLLHTIGLQLE